MRGTGQVTVGGIVTDANSKDPSKFEQYQDLSNGVLSNIGIFGRTSKSWIDAYGENFGRDDMYINMRGGMYDVFRARAYTNWMPHNLLFNGLTPFTAARHREPDGDTSRSPIRRRWQPLDLGFQRKDTGGSFEWQAYSPWYFRVDGNQVKQSGTKVGSGSNGTSPGNGFTDLPLPAQYETNNVTGEIGYATRAMTLSASYMVSNFNNSNSAVNWNNGFWGNGIDTTWLPPEKQLPAIRAQRHVAAAAVELVAGVPLHVGQDEERPHHRPDHPERRRGASRRCCPIRPRSTVTRSARRSPPAGPRRRSPIWTRGRTSTGRRWTTTARW